MVETIVKEQNKEKKNQSDSIRQLWTTLNIGTFVVNQVQSPIQDKLKEKHTESNINQTNETKLKFKNIERSKGK